jgi:hypothetical protein
MSAPQFEETVGHVSCRTETQIGLRSRRPTCRGLNRDCGALFRCPAKPTAAQCRCRGRKRDYESRSVQPRPSDWLADGPPRPDVDRSHRRDRTVTARTAPVPALVHRSRPRSRSGPPKRNEGTARPAAGTRRYSARESSRPRRMPGQARMSPGRGKERHRCCITCVQSGWQEAEPCSLPCR